MFFQTHYFPAIKNSLRQIIISDFVKNVIMLMSGSLIVNIISIGTAPITTRLFTPENFGLFALFLAIISIGSQVGSLCYERAIVLPKENEEAINVLFLSLSVLLSTTLAIFFVFLFFNNEILKLFGKTGSAAWLWFVPLGLLLSGFFNNMSFWLIRNKKFKLISFARVLEKSVSALIKICFGILIGAYAGGLIGGFILGAFVALFIVFRKFFINDFKQYRSVISLAKMKNLARLYKKFPIFSSWSVLLISFSQEIVVFAFAFLFSAKVVGFYSLCKNVLERPIELVSRSVQNVYFQKAAQDLSNGINLKRGLKKTTFGLIITGFLPFFFLAIFGKPLFTILFGKPWATAGLYVQILAPWFFLLYISSPANVVYEVCNKQDIKLALNISLTITRLIALWGGYYLSKDPLFVLGGFVMVNIIFQAIIIIVAFSIASKTNMINNG